jgi:hypothetical protein
VSAWHNFEKLQKLSHWHELFMNKLKKEPSPSPYTSDAMAQPLEQETWTAARTACFCGPVKRQ